MSIDTISGRDLLDQIGSVQWPELQLNILHSLIQNQPDGKNENGDSIHFMDILFHLSPCLEKLTDQPYPGHGINPAVFIDIIGYIHHSRNKKSQSLAGDLSVTVEKHLRQLLFKTLFRISAWEELLNLLIPDGRIPDVSRIEGLYKDSSIPPEVKREKFFEIVNSRISGDNLNILLNEQRLLSNGFQSGPSVNSLLIANNNGFSTGIIGVLSLNKAEYHKRSGIDKIRISTQIIDINDVLTEQIDALFSYLHDQLNINRKYKFNLEYDLIPTLFSLYGNSIGTALAVLARERLNRFRKNPALQTNIYKDVAITGALDNDGNVRPVNKHDLKLKVEAAFFSRINTIVIPNEQLEYCENIISGLNKRYPERDLQTAPLSKINYLAHTRNVVDVQRRKYSERVRQYIDDFSSTFAYGILGFILLSVIIWYFLVVRHPVPNHATLEDEYFHIRNKYGYEIWKSERYLNEPYKDEWLAKRQIKNSIKIGDVDNDGSQEIVIGYYYYSDPGIKGYVFCYDQGGNVRWKYRVGEPAYYGENLHDEFYFPSIIQINDLDSDGQMEIIVLSAAGVFPYQLLVLSSEGKKISEYWHAGGINDITPMEIYPDNKNKEIIIMGRNNEYKQGILLVIDPFIIDGQSPQSDPFYIRKGTNPGNEIYYILFPKTPFSTGSVRDFTDLLSVNNAGNLKFYLNSNSPQMGVNKGCVQYMLNPKMEVIYRDVMDSYYKTWRKVYPEKEPLKYNDHEILTYYLQLKYWNGHSWEDTPVINSRYLESIK